ncbi:MULTISPECIES: hypothetical protein [unclassified Paludibacterium]|uniref:hypothetical protein n=1 Tax=unclassified Paludibacterium TaxID=2618429 RepID=UPI001C047299|nr:hypothetical protein [Paludibacterium sp. B53371]BEV73357.1 hypothetical protein THUN1379_28390 [Paludibacterium sp. THUN1379]
MNVIDISRFPFRRHWALLCLCLVWSGWRLLTLPTLPVVMAKPAAAPDLQQAASRLASAHWFGPLVPPDPPGLVVLGVFAPGHGAHQPGFAIARRDGASLALLAGQQLEQWRVQAIAPDGLILAQGRHQHFYPLSRQTTPAGEGGGQDALPLPGDDE